MVLKLRAWACCEPGAWSRGEGRGSLERALCRVWVAELAGGSSRQPELTKGHPLPGEAVGVSAASCPLGSWAQTSPCHCPSWALLTPASWPPWTWRDVVGWFLSGVPRGSAHAVLGGSRCSVPCSLTRACMRVYPLLHSFLHCLAPLGSTSLVLEIPSARSCLTRLQWLLSVERGELVARRKPVGSVLGGGGQSCCFLSPTAL